MKQCSKCKDTKEFSEFSKSKARKDGHSYVCKPCTRGYYLAKKDYYDNYNSQWREDNQDKVKARWQDYYKDNSEVVKARAKKWAEANPDKMKAFAKKFRKNNPDKINAKTAKHRAKRLNATPAWLTPEQLSEIQQYYWLAKDLQSVTGEPYHVDHIVPLQGENVSGLHVPWNLQVLPQDINLSKGNSFGR